MCWIRLHSRRLPSGRAPSRATLQANISAITAATWEAINQQLMVAAYTAGVERGTMWRVDSTAIEAPVHEPTDSTLLFDGIRGMVRLLTEAEPWAPALYQDLVAVTQATLGSLEASAVALEATNVGGLASESQMAGVGITIKVGSNDVTRAKYPDRTTPTIKESQQCLTS